MYISYSSSDAYAEYTGISLLSLLHNNQDTDIEEIFLLNNGITEENLRKIRLITERYGRKLTILEVSSILNEYAMKNPIPKFHDSYSTYARIVPERIYPSYVDKLLVVDSDTIVNQSLEELSFDLMDEKVIAAIDNPDVHRNIDCICEEEKVLFYEKGFYMNCGIVLFNMMQWKKNNLPERIVEMIPQIHDMRFYDQTILNHVIKKEEYLKLDLKYNSFFHQYPKSLIKDYIKTFTGIYTEEQLKEAAYTPVILHYKGGMMRPWNKECLSLEQDVYLKYKQMSPWKDSPIQSVAKTNKEKIIYFIKKIFRNSRLVLLRKNKYVK